MNRRGFFGRCLQAAVLAATTSYFPELAVPTKVVEAPKPRKMTATWTVDTQKDLHAYYNMPPSEEHMRRMVKEIQRELDKELLEDLRRASSGR